MNTVLSVTQQQVQPPAPIRIRDTRALLALTRALKSADKAWVIWTLRGWVAHNEAKKKAYRDGHYWTFRPLEKWRQKDFDWLSVKQIASLMAQLVKQGLVIRIRPDIHKSYWYRVNESALASLCDSLPTAASLISQTAELKDKTAELKDETSDQSAQTAEHKTVVIKEGNLKQRNQKQKNTQQQHLPDEDTDVVVVTLPHPEPESISGEHSINGEGHDTTAVKAFVPHEQHHNDQPFPKVPAKGFPPLVTDLVKFGVLPPTAQRLVDQYAERDIRQILDYARAAKNLINPPGFVVDELDTGKSGVLAAPPPVSQSLSTAITGDGLPVEIEAWRLEALRRENERWAAEEAAEQPAPEYA